MISLRPLLSLLILILLSACNFQNTSRLYVWIEEHHYYDKLSSASGVSVIDDQIMIVGDDIPWLVLFNQELTEYEKVRLSGIDSMAQGRTPYILKADYECMESFKEEGITYTLIISSGSKDITRDTGVLVNHYNDEITKINLRPLFERIKNRAMMTEEEINIEGLAMSDKKAYLFHRGNVSGNFVVEIDRDELFELFKQQKLDEIDFEIYPFALPEYKGLLSGFSGATYLPEFNSLLFTASLEATNSVTSDGAVWGSYIGIIPINEIKKGIYSSVMLTMKDQVLEKKLEGINVLSTKVDKVSAVAVCDNDDGTSDLFIIGIQYKP